MAANAAQVGVTALYFYVPRGSVRHVALETHDKVSAGKYTAGLGQAAMAICDANEDAASLCLTGQTRAIPSRRPALHGLLEAAGIAPKDVGRLEVGTETLVDKAKSVKTVLMPLLTAAGNHSVEGVDCLNACYGATAALFNTVRAVPGPAVRYAFGKAAWVESTAWDGRTGVVVGGDIAIYGSTSARPTGGAGAVAMAVGPNAPLQLEARLRASYMAHEYDFFKPSLDTEYPVVDGHVSNRCFLQSLDACFAGYTAKFEAVGGRPFRLETDADHVIFHSPYTKLVQRAFARLAYLDARARPDHPYWKDPVLAPWLALAPEATRDHAELDKAFRAASQGMFEERVVPSLALPREIGNSYCASVYSALLSLLDSVGSDALQGKRIVVFSYGSGVTSTMFSFRVSGDLGRLIAPSKLSEQLADRVTATPDRFLESLAARERVYNQANVPSTGPPDWIRPGAYYLQQVTAHRRTYVRHGGAPSPAS